MPVSTFGQLSDGRDVQAVTLRDGDVSTEILTIGATWRSQHVPGRDGVADVLLGFDAADHYAKPHPYFGSTVGRVAGRITGASFDLDGKTFTIDKNEPKDEPKHGLHGGFSGWDKQLWTLDDAGDTSARFSLVSPDGDGGFPGRVNVSVTYTLANGTVSLDYEATTDAPTPIAPTNHAYINLRGHDTGDVRDHRLVVHADTFAASRTDYSFTGQRLPVDGTPDDLRRPTLFADRIDQLAGRHGSMYFVNGTPGELRDVAEVTCEAAGRRLSVATTETCLQFYTGLMTNEQSSGKGGASYGQFSALCLEAQAFPDALNHDNPQLGNLVLRPGETYRQTTSYCFDTI